MSQQVVSWQVRSIDEEQEEGYTGLIEEGRVIEAHTEPLQGADSAEQQPLQQEEGSAGTPPEAAEGRDQVAADDRSVWQRLRGIRRGAQGAKPGEGGVNQNGRGADSGGRLSAGRILERSTSRNGGTGGADPFAKMLGLGSGDIQQQIDNCHTPDQIMWACIIAVAEMRKAGQQCLYLKTLFHHTIDLLFDEEGRRSRDFEMSYWLCCRDSEAIKAAAV